MKRRTLIWASACTLAVPGIASSASKAESQAEARKAFLAAAELSGGVITGASSAARVLPWMTEINLRRNDGKSWPRNAGQHKPAIS